MKTFLSGVAGLVLGYHVNKANNIKLKDRIRELEDEIVLHQSENNETRSQTEERRFYITLNHTNKDAMFGYGRYRVYTGDPCGAYDRFNFDKDFVSGVSVILDMNKSGFLDVASYIRPSLDYLMRRFAESGITYRSEIPTHVDNIVIKHSIYHLHDNLDSFKLNVAELDKYTLNVKQPAIQILESGDSETINILKFVNIEYKISMYDVLILGPYGRYTSNQRGLLFYLLSRYNISISEDHSQLMFEKVKILPSEQLVGNLENEEMNFWDVSGKFNHTCIEWQTSVCGGWYIITDYAYSIIKAINDVIYRDFPYRDQVNISPISCIVRYNVGLLHPLFKLNYTPVEQEVDVCKYGCFSNDNFRFILDTNSEFTESVESTNRIIQESMDRVYLPGLSQAYIPSFSIDKLGPNTIGHLVNRMYVSGDGNVWSGADGITGGLFPMYGPETASPIKLYTSNVPFVSYTTEQIAYIKNYYNTNKFMDRCVRPIHELKVKEYDNQLVKINIQNSDSVFTLSEYPLNVIDVDGGTLDVNYHEQIYAYLGYGEDDEEKINLGEIPDTY